MSFPVQILRRNDHVSGIASLARQHGELAQASSAVITARFELAASPHVMTADGQAEMARMLPEKAQAFAHAGSEIVTHFNAMLLKAGSDWLREASYATRAAAALVTAPSPAAALTVQQAYLAGLATRMTEAGNSLFAATTALQTAALAPVHRTATSNARRLRR